MIDEESVLLVVPVLNEEKHLEACIAGLLGQDYRGPMTIVIVDGGSTDATQAIAARIGTAHPNVRLLMNPRRIQSAAVNLAAASDLPGTILVRADAHADYPPHFVSRCVEALRANAADSVVVSMRTVGLRPFQRAVAAAQNSILGNGGSAHRRNTASRFVDHGHHAAFRRAFFLGVNGYDETFTHNEDAEFDARAAAANGRIWLCAEATITYYPRAEIGSLARQYYHYGRGRARNLVRHRTRPKLRQLAPLLMTASAVTSLAIGAVEPLALLVLAAYVALYAGWSVAAAVRMRDPAILAMGLAAAVMHISWSAGFLTMMAEAIRTRQMQASSVTAS
ncbi:glycosyltransferase family 2 protein [Methylorubrum sp. SL192]|uniref:glycosyltransferase family 2 protein n=1 Tax=Methylorubrum sp. SL192 TaxID=2995167 RepID=UPI0022755437|nr:glycosyltransferase family 2 protein [Methylorubrum sp. SL192]MCY1641020.1 glycosyltransferase family 2 protein [Methylorubrum sp. SL192]